MDTKTGSGKSRSRVSKTAKSGTNKVFSDVEAPTKKSSILDRIQRSKGFRPTGAKNLRIVYGLKPLAAHDLVTRGLPVAKVQELMDAFHLISRETVLRTMGISERTLQRKSAMKQVLDVNVSDRAVRLASITSHAIDVLGSQEAAERWLSQPALGLDKRTPIELLQSSEGADLVKTLLTRMDYGVYA